MTDPIAKDEDGFSGVHSSFGKKSQEIGPASSSSAHIARDIEKEAPLRKLDSKTQGEKEDVDSFSHLSEHEAEILTRQLRVPEVKVSFFSLYRYATTTDVIILAISAICAIAAGVVFPLMTIVFGRLVGQFANFQNSGDHKAFSDEVTTNVLYFVYIAVGEFVTTYISSVGFIYTGEHVVQKIRERYLAAMLRQNIAFFDKLGAGEITTRITADTNTIQEGVSEKVGLTLSSMSAFVTSFVISFFYNWRLAFILSSTVWVLLLVIGVSSTWIIKWASNTHESYAKGGAIVEEVLSTMRNTTAFNTQEKLARLYGTYLIEATYWGKRMQMLLGYMMAMIMTLMFLNYALTFWQGSRYLVSGAINVSEVIVICFAIMIGGFSLVDISPKGKAFTAAVATAQKIYSTIDRTSPINPDSNEGEKLPHLKGTVELRNIRHIYPSRPEVVVIEDMSLSIPAGQITAIVGTSGSGKSTIVSLVERFYDPIRGQVLIDGVDIRTLNVRWLRQHISLVQQEPILFSTSIENNIRYGLFNTELESINEEDRIKELIVDAAKMANAHDFITALPEGYDTIVGERGCLLSGGQKQRIAIARAVISDPRILLLDEATSALDTKSEGVVQAALDRVARGRTIITIAHRLSTVKAADNIVVISQGRIIDQGKHDELLEKKGAFYNLVEAQKITMRQKERAKVEGEASILDEKSEAAGTTTPSKEKSGALENDTNDDNAWTNLRPTPSGQSASSKYSIWTLIKVVAKFNVQEWPLMTFGFFCCIIAGGINTTQAVLFVKSVISMSLPVSMYRELRSDIDFWCWMYFMHAILYLLSVSGQGAALGWCSENLIHRARNQTFRTILRQEIGFFDREENAVGALTSFLSTETTHLAGLSGATLGTLVMVSTTLIASITLAISIGWKVGLVCTATIPVWLMCGFLRIWMLAQFQAKAKKAYESSASYASEATSAIRTVASLTMERNIWKHYHEQLVAQGQKSLLSILKTSTLYASSQSLMFLCEALGFWYGGTLVANGEYTVFQFFLSFVAIIFAAESSSTFFSFAPDIGKAKHAATRLKELFDRIPEIDTWSQEGKKVSSVEGSIEFRDVHFSYPTRPKQPVLRGLRITVKPGQYVALVGASGCGKSTAIALLERFYDALAGGVYVDGNEVTGLNLVDYRRHLALVSQEPTLYQGTIRENILLGVDGGDEVSDSQVERVCREANIWEFVCSLPDGLQTLCGSKGILLSSGQKQRIAIARALLRNPKILLLDEATSALDSESEKIVQEALDKAAKGRTTIAVAHRLSTIQKADLIYVMDNGRVVEMGTHAELVQKKGQYFELVNLQSLGKMG